VSNGLFTSAPYEVVSESQYLNYVYLTCRDKAAGKLLKLTALHDNVLNNAEAKQEFSQLVKLQKRVTHPSVSAVLAHHEVGEIGDREYLVTETLSSTLEEILQQQTLEPSKVESLILKIATGLTAVHAAGVLHLDLKPAHILVDEHCASIKIDNFESACEIGVQITSIAMDPKYSAPEKYLSDTQINEQADIYSLGIIAFELALGSELFREVFADIYDTSDLNLQDQRWLHWHMNISAKPEPLAALKGGFSDRFSDAVAKMMSKDQAGRYLDLSGVINDLGGLHEGGVKPLVQPLDPNAPPAKKSNRWAWLTFSLIFLMLAGGGGYYGYDLYKKRELGELLQLELGRVIEKRAEAADLGADETMPRWVEAESSFTAGKERYDTGELEQAIRALKQAYQGYVDVIDLLQNVEVIAAREAYQAMLDRVLTVRVSESYAGYRSAAEYAQRAEKAAAEQDVAAAVEAFEYGTAELEIALRQAPRQFFQGSTSDGIEQALALCNSFQDGCEKDWYSDEAGKIVEVAPFYIDREEVSVAAFESFAKSTNYKTTAESRGFSYLILGESSSRTAGAYWNNVTGLDTPHYGSSRSPVLHTSHSDAMAYCDWKGMRLPTEAEWEYAATGSGDRLFAWGSDWRDEESKGFVDESGNRLLASVDSYGVTPEGLAGITGGVWEWTTTETSRGDVISKGGAWSDVNPAHLRIQVRRAEAPTYSSNDIGFRCAQSTVSWDGLFGSEL